MELTIPAALGAAAGKFGDAPALAEPGGPRISYHQLLRQPSTVARALIAEGVAHGDRVAIWSPNTHHWVLAAFGALSAGATLVPVSTRFTGPEALDVITRSGASVLIVADRFLGTDRFAALRTAAAIEAAHTGAGAESYTAERRLVAGQLPGQLRLVVRVPMPDATEPAPSAGTEDGVIGWAKLLDRAEAVPASAAEQRAAAVRSAPNRSAPRNGSATISTDAPLRVITSSASGPVNRVLTGTSVAPADNAPNAARTQ